MLINARVIFFSFFVFQETSKYDVYNQHNQQVIMLQNILLTKSFKGNNLEPKTHLEMVIIMGIRKRLQRKITLQVYQIQSMLVITTLTILLLITNWPRFMNDAMEFSWFWYVILIAIFLLIFSQSYLRKT